MPKKLPSLPNEFIKFKLIRIDAWKGSYGWEWNNYYILEEDIFFQHTELTPRKILKYLRKWDYLTSDSKGKLIVEGWAQGDMCFVISNRKKGRPILALSAIH